MSDFIGEANLLEGEVADLDEDGISVLVEGLEVRAAYSEEELHPGQHVSVMVRPEEVILGPHAAGLDCNRCRGTVLHRTYQGTMVRYEVELTSHQHIFADSNQTAEADLFDIGDTIDLGWKSDSVVVLTS